MEDYSEAVHPGSRELLRTLALKKTEIGADMVANEEERKRRLVVFTLPKSKRQEKLGTRLWGPEGQWLRGLEEHEPPVRAASGHPKDERNC